MADADVAREKKKRFHKKIDQEFDSFDFDKMRTLNHYTKRGSYKGSQSYDDSTNNFHSGGYSYWEKRNNRKYHGESTYKGWKNYEGSKDEKYKNDSGRPPGEEIDSQLVVTPVILAREKQPIEKQETPASALLKKTELLLKEANPVKPPRSYQIASKPSVLEGIVFPETEMISSIKFLDEYLDPMDDFNSFLLDQNDFLIVAVVGLQSCGKSTIASLLADPSKVDLFASSSVSSWIFHPESRDEVLSGCHSTNGIDAFITKERVIILDLQPLLSPSVMDYIVTQERKASLDFGSTENLLEVESLQLLTFAMSISHVLIVVQDYIFHPNLIRLLHTCQMMKPTSSSNHSSTSSHQGNRDNLSRSTFDGSESHQYFPHVVLVHNRSLPQHFDPAFIEEIQSLYQTTLSDSSLCLDSQIGICSGVFSPPLGSISTHLNLNLFFLPDISQQQKCPFSLMEGMIEMRRQIFSLSRCPLTHVKLTEKSWLQYATRMWESIRKSSLYVEYSRLLP